MMAMGDNHCLSPHGKPGPNTWPIRRVVLVTAGVRVVGKIPVSAPPRAFGEVARQQAVGFVASAPEN
jgi:hypothetical protein